MNFAPQKLILLGLLSSVVVVLQVKTYVYKFEDLTIMDCLDTCNN